MAPGSPPPITAAIAPEPTIAPEATIAAEVPTPEPGGLDRALVVAGGSLILAFLDDVVQRRVGRLDLDVRLVVAARQSIGVLGAEQVGGPKAQAHKAKAIHKTAPGELAFVKLLLDAFGFLLHFIEVIGH